MKIKCSLKTPIFIGCGEEYSYIDYYVKDGKAHIIDLEKALNDLEDIKKIDEISKYIVQNTYGNRVDINAKEILERVGLSPENYVSYSIDCEFKEDRRVRIKKFIHQNNKKYIPGSSIKGAIRTAYLFNYYDKHFDELGSILDNENIKPHDKGTALEIVALEGVNLDNVNKVRKNPVNDFFKYIKVSDSLDFVDWKNIKFVMTKRWNYKKGKLMIPIYLEVMGKGDFTIDIKFDDKFFEILNKRLNNNYSFKNDEEKFEVLKELCNNFSKTVVEFELKRNLPPKLNKFYGKLLSDIKRGDSLYINLGFGGGFLNKTIYPLLWKKDPNNLLFNKIREYFLDLYKPKFKLYKTWESAKSYLDFPTTKNLYIKDNKIVSPLGWIKMVIE